MFPVTLNDLIINIHTSCTQKSQFHSLHRLQWESEAIYTIQGPLNSHLETVYSYLVHNFKQVGY